MDDRKVYESEALPYIVGHAVFVILCLISFLMMRYPEWFEYTCSIKKMAGIICPACGGTRAVRALLRGHVIESFCYHPAVLYMLVIYGWYMMSWNIELISRHRLAIGMRRRLGYVYILVAIVMIQWVIKLL